MTPTPDDLARDLYADLWLCAQARVCNDDDTAFLLAANDGWPVAIRRAQMAEAEIEKLKAEMEHLQKRVEFEHSFVKCYQQLAEIATNNDKERDREIKRLKAIVSSLAQRCVEQSELLSRKAEK